MTLRAFGWVVIACLSFLYLTGAFLVLNKLDKRPEDTPSGLAVLDDQGLCWIGDSGLRRGKLAIIHTEGGDLLLHRPAIVFRFDKSVSEATLARVLHLKPSECTRLQGPKRQ